MRRGQDVTEGQGETDEELEKRRKDEEGKAKESASRHPRALTPGVEFTERDVKFNILYHDLRHGQFKLKSLRGLPREQLEWVAAHTVPPPGPYDRGEWGKLRANAMQASWLRERRVRRNVALVGGILAALLTGAASFFGARAGGQGWTCPDPVRVEIVR